MTIQQSPMSYIPGNILEEQKTDSHPVPTPPPQSLNDSCPPLEANLSSHPYANKPPPLQPSYHHLLTLYRQAIQKISQLQILNSLYSKETLLLNCQIERVVADNCRLTEIVSEMKENERNLGIKFDMSMDKMERCRQELEGEVEKLKEKCRDYERRLEFQRKSKEADQELQTEISSRQPSSSPISSLQTQLHHLQSQLSLQRQTNLSLRQSHLSDQSQWLKCRQQWNLTQSKYQQEILQLTDSNKTLNQSISQLIRSYTEELEEKRKEEQVMRGEIGMLEEEVIRLRREMDGLVEDLGVTQERIGELERELEESEKEVEALQERLKKELEREKQETKEDCSQQLISQIQVIGKQIGQLKKQFSKLSLTPQSFPTCPKSSSILHQQSQIYSQMQCLLQDLIQELHQQKRSKHILQETLLHFQSELNSYKNSSSYQELSSRLSLIPINKSERDRERERCTGLDCFGDQLSFSFKRNNSEVYEREVEQGGRVRGMRRKRTLGRKNNNVLEGDIFPYLPAPLKPHLTSITLHTLLQTPLSKYTLLAIMLSLTQSILTLSLTHPIYLTSSSIILSNFSPLSPSSLSLTLHPSTTPHPLYTSPQQLSTHKYTPESAIWTLGILFDEMIHKKLFFKSEKEIMSLSDKDKYVFRSLSWREIKPLVSNCLEKEKERRPKGREVMEELREIKQKCY